jgi:hypothetical protein
MLIYETGGGLFAIRDQLNTPNTHNSISVKNWSCPLLGSSPSDELYNWFSCKYAYIFDKITDFIDGVLSEWVILKHDFLVGQ